MWNSLTNCVWWWKSPWLNMIDTGYWAWSLQRMLYWHLLKFMYAESKTLILFLYVVLFNILLRCTTFDTRVVSKVWKILMQRVRTWVICVYMWFMSAQIIHQLNFEMLSMLIKNEAKAFKYVRLGLEQRRGLHDDKTWDKKRSSLDLRAPAARPDVRVFACQKTRNIKGYVTISPMCESHAKNDNHVRLTMYTINIIKIIIFLSICVAAKSTNMWIS